MSAYLIYDKKTGEILHTHIEFSLAAAPAALSSEDLLRVAKEHGGPASRVPPHELATLEVNETVFHTVPPTGSHLRVDTKSGGVVVEKSEKREKH